MIKLAGFILLAFGISIALANDHFIILGLTYTPPIPCSVNLFLNHTLECSAVTFPLLGM